MNNIVDIKDKAKPPKTASAGNGGGFDMTDLEKRVGNLEADMKEVKKSLHGIEIILARIEGELKTKASAVELAEVKGRISQVPNTWQMITMILGSQITLFGLFFALIKFGIK